MNGHKIINQNGLHFLTFTVVGWVDVFTRLSYKEVIINSGWVLRAEDYVFSSARWYLEREGKLKVKILDFNNLAGYVDT